MKCKHCNKPIVTPYVTKTGVYCTNLCFVKSVKGQKWNASSVNARLQSCTPQKTVNSVIVPATRFTRKVNWRLNFQLPTLSSFTQTSTPQWTDMSSKTYCFNCHQKHENFIVIRGRPYCSQDCAKRVSNSNLGRKLRQMPRCIRH